MELKSFFIELGIKQGDNVLVHSSYRNIKKAFPGVSIESFIKNLQELITPEGSLVFPAFTYCFKKTNTEYEIFDMSFSPAKTGAAADVFRTMPEVIRTSSPTHSFSLWGKINEFISYTNSPQSPLGKGSVLDWFAENDNSYILMAGVDFSSFSFGHYLEIIADVPWRDFSPWDYLSVQPTGISVEGEIDLKEIPGCAKSFIRFENFLITNNIIEDRNKEDIKFSFIPVKTIITHGINFFRDNHDILLCPKGTCKACDARHEFIERKINEKI